MSLSTPSPAWEQVYEGIHALRILLSFDPDYANVAPRLLEWLNAARAADASQIEIERAEWLHTAAELNGGWRDAVKRAEAAEARCEAFTEVCNEGGVKIERLEAQVAALSAQVEQARRTSEYWKAEHIAANTTVAQLTQEKDEAVKILLNLVREEPNEHGEYVHATHCNASRKEPMGNAMCSCATGKRIKALQAELAQLRQQGAEKEQ